MDWIGKWNGTPQQATWFEDTGDLSSGYPWLSEMLKDGSGIDSRKGVITEWESMGISYDRTVLMGIYIDVNPLRQRDLFSLP